MQKILVTGGAGYIGSVLVRKLLEENYSVRVIDILKYGDISLAEVKKNKNFELCKCDIRDAKEVEKHLKGIDAIVHLAAIVGDPACKKEPQLAKEINLDASINLFEAAKKNNVKRFVFASTCSNYGKMSDSNSFVAETSELKPVSLYANLKVEVERNIFANKQEDDFTPVVLRFATAYGLSPRMRFDLTVNEFTRELTLGRELVVFGEQFWRPYCHVEDLAKACILALKTEKNTVKNNVFNVGDTDENYQKEKIVNIIKSKINDCRVKYVHKDEDPRDYRVNFSKIKKELKFNISKRVPDGIDEIIKCLKRNEIKNPDSPVYQNT